MSSFPLRIPDDLKKEAIAQAEAAGVSLNQYIATALASRVGAQAEAERYFAARGARAERGRAKEILSRSGIGNHPRDDDVLGPSLGALVQGGSRAECCLGSLFFRRHEPHRTSHTLTCFPGRRARPGPRPGPCIRVRSGRRARVPGRRGRPPGAGTSGSAGQGISPNARLLAAASLVKWPGRGAVLV